jgi:hypothetical protein
MTGYSSRAFRGTAALAMAAALAGCTTGQVGVGPPVSSAAAGSFTLKFGVGTATIGTTLGKSIIGLNVTATFRQSNAQNATATNTPTLTGPATFKINNAPFHSITGITPGALEAAAAQAQQGNPYVPPTNALFATEFGVFGDGMDQLNLIDTQAFAIAFPGSIGYGFDGCGPQLDGTGPTSNGQTEGFEYTPMPKQVSLPCPGGGLGIPGVVQQSYYGGPPAWPAPQGYGQPTGFIGFPLGFLDFDDVTPVAGTYSLDVAYSINATATQYAHADATARLANVAPLAGFTTPVVSPQSDGSGLVTVNVPPGVTEALVMVVATACQLDPTTGVTLAPRHFSLLTRQIGPQSLLLSSKLGPPDSSGNPTDTFCTAADDQKPNASSNHSFTVSAVGFDYPAFEASYPQSTTPGPTIANAAGQADVTTSAPVTSDYSLTSP